MRALKGLRHPWRHPFGNGRSHGFRADEAVATLDHPVGDLSEVVFSVTLPLPLPERGEPPHAGPRLCIGASPSALRIRRRLEPDTGGRTWLLELEIDMRNPDPETILAECEGFLVDDSAGREVGVVEEVEADPDGAVTALVVAGGWFGRRRTRIPVDAIDTVVPSGRRIVVRR